MAQEQLFALVVSNGNAWRGDLEEFLRKLQISFRNVKSCGQLVSALDMSQPQVIITAAELHDGTWRDIARLVGKARVPTSIIVVAEGKASRPYLPATINHGVFECIRPPFESEMQACIINVAAKDARRRREVQAVETLNYLV